MKDILIKWFMSANAFLLRATNGRIGGKLDTQTILLLETTSRKSGRPHVIPIAYFLHEGLYLIVASNWGRDWHADWYLKWSNKAEPGDFVEYISANEPDTLLYTSLQEKENLDHFLHYFVFKDETARDLHTNSAAVKHFTGLLYPNLIAPIEFTEYNVCAGTK